MASYYDNTDRWIGRILHDSSEREMPRSDRVKIFSDGDEIYSYGYHFEMARLLRDRKGQPVAFLVNGDRASVTTDRHQSAVRGSIAESGLPSVIVPYGALNAAGISLRTVELIDVQEDRWETTEHVVYEQPEGARWIDREVEGYRDLTDDELAAKVAKKNAEEAEQFQRCRGYALQEQEDGVVGRRTWSRYLEPGAGPKVITVEDLSPHERMTWQVLRTDRVLVRSNFGGDIDVKVLDDGRTEYSWTTRRHWLGESLIRAKLDTTSTRICTSCKGTGRVKDDPLAWLPVDNRQSSAWFDARWELRSAGACPKCNGRGQITVSVGRRAFFLSGFDHNEPRPVYFFCELPKGAKPTTVDEAYEDLKPETVKLAEQMGRVVRRQGDIFAIELRGATKRELRKQGARFEKRGQLLGTNHVGTEVAYMPDGTTLVRGTLWHVPEGRRPDHVRVAVGKSWHIAIKNTVPVTR